MKRSVLCLAMLVALAVLAQACQGDFATMGQAKRLTVTVTQGAAGTPGQRLPLSIVQPTSFTVTVEAQLPDGSVDTSFNGYVNIFSQPGTVSGLSVGNVDLQGNVQLQNGTITGVVVPIVAAFGETHIWADDIGYDPSSPVGSTAPQYYGLALPGPFFANDTLPTEYYLTQSLDPKFSLLLGKLNVLYLADQTLFGDGYKYYFARYYKIA